MSVLGNKGEMSYLVGVKLSPGWIYGALNKLEPIFRSEADAWKAFGKSSADIAAYYQPINPILVNKSSEFFTLFDTFIKKCEVLSIPLHYQMVGSMKGYGSDLQIVAGKLKSPLAHSATFKSLIPKLLEEHMRQEVVTDETIETFMSFLNYIKKDRRDALRALQNPNMQGGADAVQKMISEGWNVESFYEQIRLAQLLR